MNSTEQSLVNIPVEDQITLPDGAVVGSWNGDHIKDLQKEIQRIQSEQKSNGSPRSNFVTKFGVPHQEQVPIHLKDFIAYIIWGVDKFGQALVASRANRIEEVDYISEWVGNTLAQDAKNRAVDPNSGCK
ncbi:MAG: hypothetical protein ISQ60_00265 [Gammaproteobacteria bacterium]|nr:hypothetical protein [Gammaproteobacteria bacterium]MBL6818728.1 hypothetical protein [Gammaproteobacteria bacterium]MBL6899167.1 hypothetical protein [Gammaproteobacteria bacterium]